MAVGGLALGGVPRAVASNESNSLGGVAPLDPTWAQDPAFVTAKLQGRVVVLPSGQAATLDAPAGAPAAYPSSKVLSTSVISKIEEPFGIGADDKGKSYQDWNYWNLCGEGAVAVGLYYWPNSSAMVTGIAGDTYTEPNPGYSGLKTGGHRWYASTFWWGSNNGINGRGLIMYLAMIERPAPRLGQWQYPGIFNWQVYPGSTDYGTDMGRQTDALNWEASGRTTLTWFYVHAAVSLLSQTTLHNYVLSDINQSGVPMIADAKTADGVRNLPQWSRTGSRVNHSVAIVGYNDTASTYYVMDTCGPGCNSTGLSVGVRSISQYNLWMLISEESDGDGIVW